MFKVLSALSVMALLITGCSGLPFTPVAVPSATNTTRAAAQAGIPTVHLESSGSSVQGLQIASQWLDANGLGGGGGGIQIPNPPSFPGILDVQAGQGVEIVVTPNIPVPVFVVTELDMQGVPTVSSVLKPTTGGTSYSLHAAGHFVLQVTLQQSWQQYLTYLFEVNVTP